MALINVNLPPSFTRFISCSLPRKPFKKNGFFYQHHDAG